MKKGDIFDRGGFLYRIYGDAEIYNRHGHFHPGLWVDSFCAECGALFDFKATRWVLRSKSQPRRCEKHRSPGRAATSTLRADMAAAGRRLKRRGVRPNRERMIAEVWSAYDKRSRLPRLLTVTISPKGRPQAIRVESRSALPRPEQTRPVVEPQRTPSVADMLA